MNFAVFVFILTSKLPVPSLLLSFILNLTTATHCTIIFHSLRQKKLQNIQNSLSRAVTKTPKSSHITPFLKSLHWLKINEHIKYKLLSLTYKVLRTTQPQYLHDSISVQRCHDTRSSMVTLARPPIRSSLKITNRCFRYAAPCLWNQLPTDLRELVRYSFRTRTLLNFKSMHVPSFISFHSFMLCASASVYVRHCSRKWLSDVQK